MRGLNKRVRGLEELQSSALSRRVRQALCCAALMLAFLGSTTTSLFAQNDQSQGDLGLQDLANKVELHTLSNGLRVLFYRRGVAPVFAGVVTTRVGGVDETLGETGIAHMLEHMLFKGTKDLGTSDYSKERVLLQELDQLVDKYNGLVPKEGEDAKAWEAIQEKLSKLWSEEVIDRQYSQHGGTGLNATTSQELTNFFVQLPSSALEFWCWLESQRLFKPVFRQFYKERDVVLEERRTRFVDSPGGKLYEALISTAFLEHAYRFPTIGYSFDLSRLRPIQAERFHSRFYVPSNMMVSLVGDVDPERDLPIVEKYFGSLESKALSPHEQASEREQKGERRITVKHNASPSMFVGYKKPVYPDPEDAKISLMAEILAESIVSPLYKELVEKRQLATSVSTFESPGYLFPNLLVFELT
ncbi:MAG: insulinase family protein, partial [Bdellovibrionales bacterium]|nr:insulinase family protein [Bdellovibrionales bacterium]